MSILLPSSRKLLVPYVCAGFPAPAATLDVLLALAEAGADALELGVPFSDPLMDGPVIQAASRRALEAGMSLEGALDLAAAFLARSRVPLFLMSSCNPLLRMGAARFAARAGGLAGCILPDLPPEEAHLLPGLPPRVELVAPNTSDVRIRELALTRPPFLYAVAVLGVTGVRADLAACTRPFLARARALSPVPVLAGFGVSTPDQARALAAEADGVIVGSALLRALDGAPDPAAAATAFLTPFRRALDELEVPCC